MSSSSRKHLASKGDITPLHDACQLGDIDAVRKLLLDEEYVAIINHGDPDRHPPLHLACFEGHLSIVKELLSHNADPNLVDRNGWTALHGAASGSSQVHCRILSTLLMSGADASIVTRDGATPLHFIVRICLDEPDWPKLWKAIRELCSRDADMLERKNNQGETPIQIACYKKQLKVISFLAETMGANVNTINRYDETPLLCAVKSGEKDIVELLLRCGAYVELDDISDAPNILEIASSSRDSVLLTMLKDAHASQQKMIRVAATPSSDKSSIPSISIKDDGMIDTQPTSPLEDGHEDVKEPPPDVKRIFPCPSCHRSHAELPLHFHFWAPKLWQFLSEEERADGRLSIDLCSIPAEYKYFIRGIIEIRIIDLRATCDYPSFTWGVFVGISEEDFESILDRWCDDTRSSMDPIEGTIANSLPASAYSQDTMGLKVKLHMRQKGLRPIVDVLPFTGHPLEVDQREGVPLSRIISITEDLQRALVQG